MITKALSPVLCQKPAIGIDSSDIRKSWYPLMPGNP